MRDRVLWFFALGTYLALMVAIYGTDIYIRVGGVIGPVATGLISVVPAAAILGLTCPFSSRRLT